MFNEDTTQEDVTLENDIIEEEAEEVVEEEEEDTTDWKAEALKYKAILDRNKDKKSPKKETKSTKSDGFGYDVKAYLKASGIEATEFDFVQEEFNKSGFADIDQLLGNEYFQSRLDKQRAINKSAQATPSGKRSGGVATDSVDYWLSKPFAEVPKEMKQKVVNAKVKQETQKGVFYNS